ncbi:SAM-dependent methyltransferase [Streptomyces sp. NPDC057638]|uniref:SAM-dependent methyltransferase n=1 Tax=Streptomyces sp. NPDC057638 TaxID=3346190 RepID=UPI0036CFCED9
MTGPTAGVGRTALLVAAARAIESQLPDALARDPYAAAFVRAAPGTAHWPLHPDRIPDRVSDPLWGRLGGYFALRTRVLDDHLLAATRAGARQVVLLGAGLDSRALRLPWPSGRTVHELDTAGVLAFKHRVLERVGAVPRAGRRPLAIDLRGAWTTALLDSGFDPGEPTAWLAEGLLLYLPAAAEQGLIAAVDRLSAPGSTLAFETKDISAEPDRVLRGPLYTALRERLGLDLPALFAPGPRPDSAGALRARGWKVRVRTPYEFTALHGRGPLPEPDDALAANRWTFATAVRGTPGRPGAEDHRRGRGGRDVGDSPDDIPATG